MCRCLWAQHQVITGVLLTVIAFIILLMKGVKLSCWMCILLNITEGMLSIGLKVTLGSSDL